MVAATPSASDVTGISPTTPANSLESSSAGNGSDGPSKVILPALSWTTRSISATISYIVALTPGTLSTLEPVNGARAAAMNAAATSGAYCSSLRPP